MIEPIEYFENQIKDKLKQIPRAINGNAPKEVTEKILDEIYLLKECIKVFSLNGVVASVLCVNVPETWDITNGKKYKVIKEEENHFTIINDYGKEDSYHKDWLKKL